MRFGDSMAHAFPTPAGPTASRMLRLPTSAIRITALRIARTLSKRTKRLCNSKKIRPPVGSQIRQQWQCRGRQPRQPDDSIDVAGTAPPHPHFDEN